MLLFIDLNVTTLWTILMLIFFCVLIYGIFCRENRFDMMMRKFPGYKDYPIIGNAYKFSNPDDALHIFHGWLNKYGGRCRVYFGTTFKTLMISRPKDLEKIFNSPECLGKSPFHDLLKSWLGEGLIVSTGERWYKHRKILDPAFHRKILENFQSIFHENSEGLVTILKNLSGEYCEINGFISRCTLDVICGTSATLFVRRAGELEWMRFVTPWYQIPFVWNLSKYSKEHKAALDNVHQFSHKVIQERKKYFSSQNNTKIATGAKDESTSVYFNSKKRFAFLDLLLSHEASGELTEKDVQEEVDTFMFAGQDTTATNLSWVIYLLGWNRSHQERLHEELDSIFGDDISRPVEPQDLLKLKYLEMCIKEALRLYPPAPLISRTVESDFQLDKNSIVPKGAIIWINIYSAHRNPQSFPEPDEFQPERFSPENRSKVQPFSFLPFSTGPRNCIGQKFALAEEKTILANLFRNFQVESLDPPDKLITVIEVTLKAKSPGMRVKLIPR